MPSLPQVLHEAATRNATEVILESGQVPMMRTAAGSVSVGDSLSESELFDALAQVLGPDQQAELAVGNVVAFELEIDSGVWSMVTEPSVDGIVVRGRASEPSSVDPMSTPLELPKLDPLVPAPSSSVPQTASPISSQKRRTQWDLGVPDAPQEEPEPPAAPPQTNPNWSRHFDPSIESDFEIRTPTGEEPANLVDAQDEPDDEPLPEIITPAPAKSDWDEQPPTVSVAPPAKAAQLYGDGMDGGMVRPSPTPARPTPPRPTGRDTQQKLESFAPSIQPGTLCVVRGDAGEELATALEGGEYVLIDDPEPEGIMRAAAELDPGGRFCVRVEDPSVCLGWVLRRLEEGARVVVETRARTAAGARRVLLGLDASVRAEAWLDAHHVLWFGQTDQGWTRQRY